MEAADFQDVFCQRVLPKLGINDLGRLCLVSRTVRAAVQGQAHTWREAAQPVLVAKVPDNALAPAISALMQARAEADENLQSGLVDVTHFHDGGVNDMYVSSPGGTGYAAALGTGLNTLPKEFLVTYVPHIGSKLKWTLPGVLHSITWLSEVEFEVFHSHSNFEENNESQAGGVAT
ncbi:hypothetical protein WJX73_000143 [Symbiochloris irregularis]|uniref:F-box domain-containing protein n=1 Tax=Symbiochloris irregularis TaxID=706552 RepID=A0AAW1NU92_9CHLO